MQAIRNSILALFPERGPMLVDMGDCSHIEERDPGASFTGLTWKGAYFLTLNPQIAKDMTGFFSSYKARPVFFKDCDGITMFEENDRRYMFLSELKSSFDTDRIAEAKTQILSSFLKINMLLTLTQYWQLENTRVKGFIVAPPPRDPDKVSEWKRDWQKSKYASPGKRQKYNASVFCGQLLWHAEKGRPLRLTPESSFHLGPCRLGSRGIFDSMDLYYVPVPVGQQQLTLNVTDYLP